MPRIGNDESTELSRVAHALMDAQFEVDGRPESERVASVVGVMKALESDGLAQFSE